MYFYLEYSVGFYHLRLLHKQEFGNGLYLFVILALIPKILSQGLTCGFPGSVNK